MKEYVLAFTLNTGKIITTCELEMDAYFGLTQFPRRNHRIRREVRMFNKDFYNNIYPSILANVLYKNARKIRMDIGELTKNEFIVSAEFGHFCQCYRKEGGRHKSMYPNV